MMMTCHFIVLLVFSCSSMVVLALLGVELSCNKSSTTCPGDVVQCECQVTSTTLQWLADTFTAEYKFVHLGMSTPSGPHTATLCSVDSTTTPNTLTSKVT